MGKCKYCKHCSKPKKWEKLWEVCYDFDTGTGTLPLWAMIFLPIILPIGYLIYYYLNRKEK